MVHEERSESQRSSAIILITALLMAIGLVMVASTTTSFEHSIFGASIWRTTFGRQGVFLGIGFVTMLLCARFGAMFLSHRFVQTRIPPLIFGATGLLLIAALVPGLGDAHRGSQRWLSLGPAWAGLGFQPSELAKVALVVFLAWLLGSRGKNPKSLRSGFIPAAASIGCFVLLVGTADFGTAALIACVGFLMLFVAGCRARHLVAVALLGAIGLAGLVLAAPYRLQRIVAFGDVWANPQGAGYQPLQSLVTVSSGGWFGRGLGAGVQKYGYLPDSHSDFIFAVLCEETGFIGGVLVIAAFCVLTWLGLRTMWSARTPFERLLAFGITATIGIQAAMNIAVVAVVAPTTGIPLPLISVGGSGVVVFSMTLGLLAAIAARGHGSEEASSSGAVHRVPIIRAGCPVEGGPR